MIPLRASLAPSQRMSIEPAFVQVFTGGSELAPEGFLGRPASML